MDDPVAVGRALEAPFPANAIQRRQGAGNRSFEYVAAHTVIRRLNEATGNRWDFRLTRMDLHGDLWIAVGELTIPGLGTRTGIGVQKVSAGGGEDLVKGAGSDALKKAAVSFGVGIDIYGPDLEAGELPQEALQRPQNGARRGNAPVGAGRPPQRPQGASVMVAAGDLAGKIDYASSLIRNNGLDEAAELKPFLVSDIGALTEVLADRLIERLHRKVGSGAPSHLAGMAEVAERRDPDRFRA